MTNALCQQYLEDPEANAGHLETCAECRAMIAALAAKTDAQPSSIPVDELPLAPWEGSSHRPWPLVLGVAGAVVGIALVLCVIAGMTLRHVAESSLSSMDSIRGLVRSAAGSLRGASLGAQVAFGAVFVIVNVVLVALLRRAPKGIDA